MNTWNNLKPYGINSISGKVNGYYTSVNKWKASDSSLESETENYQLILNVFSASDPDNKELCQYIQEKWKVLPYFKKIEAFPKSIQVMIEIHPDKLNKVLDDVLIPFTNHLSDFHYISGCECCGDHSHELGALEFDGILSYICEDCAKVQMEMMEKEQTKMSKDMMQKSVSKNEIPPQMVPEKESPQYNTPETPILNIPKVNRIGGCVGALLGACLGSILWIILLSAGYIAGLGGLAIMLASMKGYSLLGKRLDKTGIIISVLFTLIMVYVANRIGTALIFLDAYKDTGITFMQCFTNLKELLEFTDTKGNYFTNLGMGYVFTIVACIGAVRKAL